MTALAPHPDSPLGGVRWFHHHVAGIGELSLRPVSPDDDVDLLHAWLTDPKSHFWGMTGASRADVEAMQRDIAASPLRSAWLGFRADVPVFLVEVYDPARSELADLAPWRPGDLGMHLLVAPTDRPEHGFTGAVMRTVMAFLFSDVRVARVVVEPDVRNEAVHALNAAVGFRVERRVALPDKIALLSTCTRREHEDAIGRVAEPPSDSSAHLRPDTWAAANRRLVAKALGEFTHERLLDPRPDGDGYVVTGDDGRTRYRFRAARRALDHWDVDPASVVCTREGTERALDALDLVTDLADTLALTPEARPVYLEEITSTLASLAFRLARPRRSADELLDAGFQDVEAAMIEGHPAFVANSGRLGLDLDDVHRFTPESAADVRLVWLGVHRAHATVSVSDEVDLEAFLDDEVGAGERAVLADRLRALDLDPAEYHLLPAHPWQWRHRIAVTFAGDVARRRIVLLGQTADHYRPQQSIRTFFDVTTPARHYVKTALSVVNMGFVRGLSAKYMAGTPAINDWLGALFDRDPELRDARVQLLRERVAIGYHPEQYEAVTADGSMYRQMLAALWRESPTTRLGPGHHTVTMAALLHVDPDGRAFLTAAVERSGGDAAAWVRRWLDAYLRPLLHAFYAHRVLFMPHGENVILVLDEACTVERVLLKDLAEEIIVSDPDVELPPAVERVRADVPDERRHLSLFTDVLDGVLRFVGAIAAGQGLLTEDAFWGTVAACVHDYQDARPDLADEFARHDLFVEEFPRVCLNRLQLRDHRQMVDLADPDGALQIDGTLRNPLAPFRRVAG